MKISLKFRWIIWAILIGGGITLSIITDFTLRRQGFATTEFRWYGRLLGILIIFTSMVISRNTGKTLAEYGREGNVPKFDTNKIVNKGMY
jgi:predicted permease